jgi:ABC-type glycerol-3-phosphate transport system substrate-binding protein
MKRIILIAGMALVLFSGCSKKGNAPAAGGGAADGSNLTLWSFTDELDNMTKNYYKPSHPGVNVEYTMIPTEQFPKRLDPALATGQGAPDLFALEAAFVRKYVESGLLLDITDIYEANKSKLLAYPVEVGSYNGKVYGMSWQACPGAMFYRRSLAQKYLGTDDPAIVQTYFTNLNKFLETAKLLKDKSNGACVVVSSTGDLFNVFLGARKNPWVINGKLSIDPAMEAYMDIVKTLYDNRWEGRVGQWSEGWFAGMKGELKDESGKAVEAFAYFLPTWGLHYVLKTNTPDTSGDWAMIPGPAPYRWGGTWVGAYKGTKNVAAAKEFIRYVATDDGFLESWAKDSGDMVGNLTVVNKIKDNYSEPFLGGQNHYAEFAEMAKTVDGKLTQGTDQAIENIFSETVDSFKLGEKSKADALADFKSQVESQLGL